jgi:hypothetical protein
MTEIPKSHYNKLLTGYLGTGLAILLIFLAVMVHQKSELQKDKNFYQRQSFSRKNDIDRLNQEVKDLKSQLSPFIASARQKFPEASDDRGLNLLFADIHKNHLNESNPVFEISNGRNISDYQRNRISNLLKYKPQLRVEIACPAGNPESYSLASQIYDIFDSAGWKDAGIRLTDPSMPFQETGIEFREKPPEKLQQAMLPLLDALECKREVVLNVDLPENSMRILVGTKEGPVDENIQGALHVQRDR